EMLFTCTTCGTTKTEAIPALGHEHIMASKWTADEQFHWHDASCGREEHRTGKTAHEWDNGKVTTAPTCFTEGETTYTCTTCGRTRTEAIAMIEHEWDDGKITKTPTCTTEGETTYTCTTCGRTRTESIATIEHEWNDSKTTKAPTCTTEGETTYTCTTCGETRTEAIAMTEHRWDKTFFSPLWKNDASNHWKQCADCGKKGDFAEHEWNNGEITQAPTCATEGKTTYKCTVCSRTRTEPITMTEHEWDDGKITKTPECTTEGETTYTCTMCAKTRTEAIAANGHTIIVTLTKDGERKEICSTCSYGHYWPRGGEP
ncbi:MAG: hypothetical protein HDR39_03370, partial [Treponema sp.]|nr:hypothetical protein [Treponema sp.]